MSVQTNSSSSCSGCIVTMILSVVLLWALLFGFTYHGNHYGLGGCNTKDGLKIDGDKK